MSQLVKNYSLLKHNTFGLDAYAKYYAKFESTEELKQILHNPAVKKEEIMILGGGSNVLFASDYNGVILENKIKGIEYKTISEESIILSVGGGEIWDDVVKYAVEHEFYGIENLSIIPGSAGAAPIQNIGAYGVELTDVFHSLEGIFLDNLETKSFNRDECKFDYRDSIFKGELKGKFVITTINLVLSTKKKTNTSYRALQDYFMERNVSDLSLEEIRNAVIKIRNSKLPDPNKLGNAGSFFKNPKVSDIEIEKMKSENPNIPFFNVGENQNKISAGWLIEKCGQKGKRVGNVGTHKDQALVIVNYGGATGQEVINFSRSIQQKVKDEFSILLEPEVNIINKNQQD